MLVGLAVGNLDKIFGTAKINTATTFVRTASSKALTAYRLDMNDYPSTAEGLAALAWPRPTSAVPQLEGPYIGPRPTS